MKHILFFIILFTNIIFCQIDTTNWYPLQIGNKWQYYSGLTDMEYFSVEVVGDTLMPNGKVYQIFSSNNYFKYRRNEDNKFVFSYNRADSTETLLYDFISPDSTFWDSQFNDFYYGIERTEKNCNLLPNIKLSCKIFDFVKIDSSVSPPVTIFGAMLDIFPTQITKGIGVTSPSYGNFSGLAGAIINGDTIGTITSLEKKEIIGNSFTLSQNYPNPFNPTTNIEYTIPNVADANFASAKNVTLKVFDVLGREVATLVNQVQKSGNYKVNFDGSNLSSGIYFYQLKYGNYNKINKMILLK